MNVNVEYIMNFFLPEEIVNHILSYAGMVKERNGKYMRQIDKKDVRYAILGKISRDIEFISSRWKFLQVNKFCKITINLHEEGDGVHYCYTFEARCSDKNKCNLGNLCIYCKTRVNYYRYLNRSYDYYCT